MNTTALPYGAVELKRTFQRYWLLGFVLSFLVHLSVVGVLEWRAFPPPVTRVIFDGPNPHMDLLPSPQRYVSGILEVPPVPKGAHGFPGHDGLPVPMPDRLAPLDQTIRTQGERRDFVAPDVVIPPEPSEQEPPIFRVVEQEPHLVHSHPAVYPEAARLAGLEGNVVVRIWVDREGNPRKAVVERSTYPIFDASACEAAMQFRFTAAINAGQPVPVWVRIPFVFRLH
jgi:TonB family protein